MMSLVGGCLLRACRRSQPEGSQMPVRSLPDGWWIQRMSEADTSQLPAGIDLKGSSMCGIAYAVAGRNTKFA